MSPSSRPRLSAGANPALPPSVARLAARPRALWAGFCLFLLVGSNARGTPPEETLPGIPTPASSGVSETVEKIMAREAALRGPRTPAEAEFEKIRRERKDLPQNPLSPFVSSWPPAPREPMARPEPLAPQTPTLSFTAATLSGTNPTYAFPPDTMGAVGPTQFIVALNGRIASFSKDSGQADGALNASMDNFFASVRGGARTSDPRIRYDRLSGRWFVIMINVVQPNRVLAAVSNASTVAASSSFTFFSFPIDSLPPAIQTSCLADYPSLGVDANALYIGVNEFCGDPLTFSGSDAFVVRKASVLGAGPIVVTAFRSLTGGPSGSGPVSPQGVDNFDPGASEGYIVGVDNASFGTLMLRRVLNPGTSPSIGANVPIAVPATRQPIPVPHKGNTVFPTGALDPVDDRLFAAYFRNGRLWTAHNIGVDNNGGVLATATRNGSRWYEISGIASGTTPSVVQAGTLFAATSSNDVNQLSYFIPSVMVSGQGHVALGCSTAGANDYVNAASAGRLASDSLGTLQPVAFLTASTTAYDPTADMGGQTGRRRWGDYSYTTVDPNDDMTFWTVQQFCDTTDSYGVRVVKLLAPPPATPSSCSPANMVQGSSNVSVTLTGTSAGGSGFFDPGSSFPNRLTATVNGGGVTVNTVTFTGPTSLTLNLTVASNASQGARTVTITNPDGQTKTSATGILTVASGAPASVTAAAGTPQSARVNTVFGTALQASVTNVSGLPLPGVTVTFTAPLSGPSGTFVGASRTASAVTDAGGIATAPAFTAGSVAGPYSVNASVTGAGPAIFTLTNLAGTPASIVATGGTPQSTTVRSTFATPLSVTVRDSGSNPVPGIVVTFTAPSSGAGGTFPGGLFTATATTAANGIASAPALTANATAGSFTVSAIAVGFAGVAYFNLTSTAATPASISATAGSPQSTPVGTAFTSPLQATVRDAGGSAVGGALVTFTSPASGARATFPGGLSTAQVQTSAGGVAISPALTAGTTAGSYSVTASVAGVLAPAAFSLTNSTGAPSTISATAGTPQSSVVGTAYATALQAVVRDAYGNAVSGVAATFTAPASGASASFLGGALTAAATTDANGLATAPSLTANRTAGGFSVTATAPGVGTPATFSLANTSAAPATIVASGGTPQSATVNSPFSTPLSATVRDASGSPVTGVVVTFSVPASGPRATFPGGAVTAAVATNASGVATAPTLTASSQAGSYSATASVPGLPAPATFALTNNASAPASILATAGGQQAAVVGTVFTSPLAATVKDSTGAPLASLVVTFSAPTSGASAAFAGGGTTATAVTDATGTATSPALTANAIAGSYLVSAAVAGLQATAAFSLTNLTGGAASIVAAGGTPQAARANVAFAAPLVASVLDASGAPVTGASVTFTAPTSGARATFPAGASSTTVVTDVGGLATSPVLTASSTTGSFTVSATVPGVSGAAPFSLTIVAEAPASIAPQAGTPQSAALGSALALPLSAVVQDSFGNGVAGVTVTFTAPASGPSGSYAGGGTTAAVTTGTNGVATAPAFTANGSTGSYAVTATVSGVASPAVFALTNVGGPPASLALVASPNPATLGQPVTLTATASGSSGTPTGPVTFRDGAASLGTTQLAGGVASLVTSSLAAGSRTLTAYYAGDTTYAASLSTPVSELVTTSGGCASGSNASLCLQGGRFRLQVFWRNPYGGGGSGAGTAVSLTSETGYFWFFAASNVELVVKVLDGRAINGSFWVLYGALSNLEYTLTVTDTWNGTTKTYYNPPSNLASLVDTSAFPGP